MKIKFYNLVLVLYFIIAFIFLYFIGIDSINGFNDIEFFADSVAYEEMYNDKLYKETGLFSVGSNFLGPIVILELTNGNRWLVFFLNCIVLFLTIHLIRNSSFINKKVFVFLLLLNPLVFQSLLFVNKEIFSIISVVLFFLWVDNKKILYLLSAIAFSVLVRWQLVLIFVVLIPVVIYFNDTYLRRWFILISFVISISVAFKLLVGFFGGVIGNFNYYSDLHDGGGLFIVLNQIQTDGFFFLIWLLKFLQISFALSFKIFDIFSFSNFQNDVVIVLSSFSYLMVFLYGLKLRIYSFKNKFFIVFMFLSVFFSLSVIFAPRYFLSVFVFLTLMISLKKGCRRD